ncbi:MAG: Glutamyl-tRNA(Gln) amidotransferase subunit A [Candidatus Marinimicrobia bacterium]|nr:Glutamyl-tRNA(Gln) amidotransferase subunit A [Candidatus Neomarinimicrobiota bacterium]
MDKIGPIARNVEDCAIVFNAIYGPDGKDQSVIDAPFRYSPEVNWDSLKIGYTKSLFDAEYSNHKNDSLTLAKMRSLGVEIVPIELPDFPVEHLSFILNAEAAAAFDELTRSGRDDLMVRQVKNAWPNVCRASRLIPAVEYIQANRARTQLIQKMAEVMQDVDVYLAPTYGGDNLLLTNLTGHPCVVLPNGFEEDGTPMSISFMGQLFDEGMLLTVAKQYQDATDFHEKHPPEFVE